MAEFPFLPLATDAYLGDTTHLTTLEHGAYLLLLMTAWRTADCCLPDDDKMLARYTGMSAPNWKKVRPVIAEFWLIEDGKWRQRRLEKTRTEAQKRSSSARDSARSRWLKTNETADANASKADTGSQCDGNANQNHNLKEEEPSGSSPPKPPTQKPLVFLIPDWVPEAEWSGFLEMRRKIRAPLTDRAMGSIIRKLENLAEAGFPPGPVLDQSTRNSWRDVFQLRDDEDGKRSMARHNGANSSDRPYRRSIGLEMLEDARRQRDAEQRANGGA